MIKRDLSILMPFKNEEKFLRLTLDSILRQSERDFEVIAVDDHSNDESKKIVNEYVAKDPRFRLFTNDGCGTICALQTALKNATGKFVTRQDADDLQPVNKLRELKQLLLSNGPGHVATGHVKYFCEGELGDGFLKYERWLNDLCLNSFHESHLFKECVIASSNWLLYTEDLLKINAISEARYPEDYFMIFKLFEHGLKVVSSENITHLWRDHPDRASRTLEQYRDQKFFPMKVEFFKKFHGTEYITLWGSGPSGKKLAKELLRAGISFYWVSNNDNKIGKTIYGVKIYDYKSLREKCPQNIIISVTQRGSSKEIDEFINSIEILQRFYF